MFLRRVLLFLLALGLLAHSQSYDLLKPEVVRSRLERFQGKDIQREASLKQIFEQAGCSEPNLAEQKIRHREDPNLICTLPGASDRTIIVGAHYDHIARGEGVIDNWTGASLLPSLYQGLKRLPRKHTFVFVAFADEESGLIGSSFYADHLSKEQRSKVDAMVNMDSLGLGPTEVWASRADKTLVSAIVFVAQQEKVPVTGMNVDGVGNTDSESFAKYKIPRITLHTITTKSWSILHSADDNMKALKWNDYLDSYRLIADYLAALDPYLPAPPK